MLGTHGLLKNTPASVFDRPRNSMSNIEEMFEKENDDAQAHGEKNTMT